VAIRRLEQKVIKTPLQKTSWIWWYTSVILATQKAGRKRIKVQDWPWAKSMRPYPKNKAKKGWGHAQVVEHLHSKYKALSSNLIITHTHTTLVVTGLGITQQYTEKIQSANFFKVNQTLI
jgi:hypothetical protein